MKPRTFARRPSSMGSNQLSKSRSSASPVQAVVVLLVMAWSPVRRSNAGISRVANPGDYATPNSNHLRDGTFLTTVANILGLALLRYEMERKAQDAATEYKRDQERADVLLRELQHRAKNNLQTIVSFLSLQRRR